MTEKGKINKRTILEFMFHTKISNTAQRCRFSQFFNHFFFLLFFSRFADGVRIVVVTIFLLCYMQWVFCTDIKYGFVDVYFVDRFDYFTNFSVFRVLCDCCCRFFSSLVGLARVLVLHAGVYGCWKWNKIVMVRRACVRWQLVQLLTNIFGWLHVWQPWCGAQSVHKAMMKKFTPYDHNSPTKSTRKTNIHTNRCNSDSWKWEEKNETTSNSPSTVVQFM